MKNRTRYLTLNLALLGTMLLSPPPRAEAQVLFCQVSYSTAVAVTTTGIADEILYSTNLLANSLNSDGDYIEVTASGRKAGNANPQTHGITFGPTTVLSTATAVSGIPYVWRMRIYYRDANTCTQNTQVQRGPNQLAARSAFFACDPTVDNEVSLVATAGAGDVTFNDFSVMLCN